MGNVKGSAISARLRFVRERHGQGGIDRLLAALTPGSRALLDARVLPQAWVPADLFIDLLVQADRLFGKGDLELCVEMGRYSAEVNLPTLYKVFYRLGSPMFILRKAASLWSVHYDSGHLTATPLAEGHARLAIEGYDRPHRAHCRSVLGWATRSVELSGGTVLSAVDEKCRAKGDDACEMAVEFS